MTAIYELPWDEWMRILIVGLFAYSSLVILLRISGNRTLAKMNAFDLIVTVSLGSALATIILGDKVQLGEGIIAFLLLIGLQFVVTWTSVRVRWIRRVVTGEPEMLFERGEFLANAMRRSRVTQGEILAAIRSAGFSDIKMVGAVVLETDGSFSVVRQDDSADQSSLADVHRAH